MILTRTFVFIKQGDFIMQLNEVVDEIPKDSILFEKNIYGTPRYFRWTKQAPYLEVFPKIDQKMNAIRKHPIQLFTAQEFHG